MDRKKMKDLAEQVMTEIDDKMEERLRQEYEGRLCKGLTAVFSNALQFINHGYHKDSQQRNKEAYEMVKPMLDDCLDKLFGKK